MMERKSFAVTLILSLLFSFLGGAFLVQTVTPELTVRGNPVVNSTTKIEGNPDDNVTLLSPEDKVYDPNNITLAFVIQGAAPPLDYFHGSVFDPFVRYGCLLDDDLSNVSMNLNNWNPNQPGFIPNSSFKMSLSPYGNNSYLCSAKLTNLSEGPHNITAWVEEELDYISYGEYVGTIFSTVSFMVDLPPVISILSPQTIVYNTSNVPLDFTVSKPVSYVSYSLDGKVNVTAIGNLTLTQLSNGAHNITVFAADNSGDVGLSRTIDFTVSKSEPSSLLPVIAVVSIIPTVIGITIGLALYRRHRKTANLR